MAFNYTRTILQLSTTRWTNIFFNHSRFILYSQLRLLSCTSKNDIKNSSALVKTLPFNRISVRNYAKGKDKKKSDKGGTNETLKERNKIKIATPKKKGNKKIAINESILTDIVDTEKLHSKFQSCVDNLKEDYIKNLSLRSTSGSIESLPVKYEGSDYKLQELAQVIRQNPKSVILNMSSFPQAIPAVLEAIESSGMNLNPQQDGTKLFIPVPKVTKELRENLAKNAKALFIKCRDNLKDVQNKFIKTIKTKEKSDGLSLDLSRNASDQVTALCKSYADQAEKIYIAKEAELLKG